MCSCATLQTIPSQPIKFLARTYSRASELWVILSCSAQNLNFVQIRVFEQVMAEPPSDGSENLQAILSACKLIDLLLVLQTVEFQM